MMFAPNESRATIIMVYKSSIEFDQKQYEGAYTTLVRFRVHIVMLAM